MRLRSITGAVVVAQTRKVEAALCRECGTNEARRSLAHNLLLGWWGLTAVVLNTIAIAQNLHLRRRLAALPEPSGEQTGPPLAPARQLLATPGLYLTGALVVLVPVLYVRGGNDRPEDRVDACVVVDRSANAVAAYVPCDGDADAQVVGVVRQRSDCPGRTDAVIHAKDDAEGLCLDLDF